jgi:hypothetical protein
MSEWTSIPIHLRLTERWKIDPNYPDDTAKWWKLQEISARRENIDTRLYARIPDIVAKWYTSNPAYERVSGGYLSAHYRMTEEQFQGAMTEYRRYGTLQRTLPDYYRGDMTVREEKYDEWLVRQDNALRDNVDSDTISMGVN